MNSLNRSNTRKLLCGFWVIFEKWIKTGLSKLISVSTRDLGRINHLKEYDESEDSIKAWYVIDGCDTGQKRFLRRFVYLGSENAF